MDDFYKRTDIDKSTVELTITIPKDSFNKSYKAMLDQELSNTKIDGFRKGKVPSNLVETELGTSIKVKVFEQLLPMYLTTALQKENLTPIAPPNYKNFPDLTKDQDLVVSVDITIMPEFKLGNLKKIQIIQEDTKVTDKEVEEAISNLFKNDNLGEKEINDKWAVKVSEKLKMDAIKSVKDFNEFVKKTIENQKKIVSRRKAEDEALNQAINICKIEIPQAAIQYEAEEREHSFVHDFGHDQSKIDTFLKSNNVSMEKMKELWLKDAKEALETDVFLKLFAREKEINVTDEELKTKIKEIVNNSPNIEDKSLFENDEWKEYVRRVEEKEKAFRAFSKEVLGE